MSYYFDAFRIDHILGFFRIWSIPLDSVEGIMGHFVPALTVNISEFEDNGILFDKQRFTCPYITEQVLTETFGENNSKVVEQFLSDSSDGTYELLPDFDTQRKVEQYFSGQEKDTLNDKLKEGLFSLISNVILLEEENSNGTEFHFRISMESTSSFDTSTRVPSGN